MVSTRALTCGSEYSAASAKRGLKQRELEPKLKYLEQGYFRTQMDGEEGRFSTGFMEAFLQIYIRKPTRESEGGMTRESEGGMWNFTIPEL